MKRQKDRHQQIVEEKMRRSPRYRQAYRKTLEKIDRAFVRQAYQDLKSGKCFPCGRRKKSGQSLCKSCYFSLPPKTRNALYKPEGYVAAYHLALLEIDCQKRSKQRAR
ncbi:hypothetical protein LCGC14_0673450 [marine sediment metagenome]|uniref:Uncharacterized protein n=1 Tax=marine sediment metagenome TaxID=412755 RepID=A0A0F9QVC3_9ZZZZ